MLPKFDDFDHGILSERQKARFSLRGFQVGDFIKRKDGLLARITHVWDDSLQTNTFSESGEGGSFHLLSNGKLSYSGALERGFPIKNLRESSERKSGACWIFHHDRHEAHNGVNCEVICKVYQELSDSEIEDKTKPARYIAVKDLSQFRGSIHSSTYTTLDGVERVTYADGETLESYLERRDGLAVYSDEELSVILKAHFDSIVTLPQEITQERFDEMLEILPPCRWQKYGNFSAFHISERLTSNLVSWFIQYPDGKSFEFVDYDNLSNAALIEKMRGALWALYGN